MKRAVRFFAVMLALIMCMSCAVAEGHGPIDFSDSEAKAANLFLSNFTEVGVRRLDSFPSDMELVDFAHDHLWFNSNDEYEYGEYYNGNNCRVSDDRIQGIVDKYFYYVPKRVELSETRFDYDGEYYYHCETGGWINDGFAHVVSICPMEDDMYYISFLIYGGGNYWKNEVMGWSVSMIEAEYGAPTGFGAAMVHAEDLSDRSTYKLVSFARLW